MNCKTPSPGTKVAGAGVAEEQQSADRLSVERLAQSDKHHLAGPDCFAGNGAARVQRVIGRTERDEVDHFIRPAFGDFFDVVQVQPENARRTRIPPRLEDRSTDVGGNGLPIHELGSSLTSGAGTLSLPATASAARLSVWSVTAA